MKQVSAAKLREFADEAREALLTQIEGSMQRKLPMYFATYEKVLDVERLPSRSECLGLMRKLDKKFGGGVYGELLRRREYFQIVHKELVGDMARLMRQLNAQNALEICAGKGKLSYWLNKEGIKITATDLGKRIKSEYVEQIGYKAALRKMNPKVVIAAWPEPAGIGLVRDVLKYPSVDNLIILGKGGYIARKYWNTIAKYGTIVPLDLRTSPSRIDSMMNDSRYSPELEKTIRKLFQVGKSRELHQSVLIRTKRQ